MQLKLLIALSFLLLTGCVTWDTLDVTVWLDRDSTGKIDIVISPVGSDKEDPYDRDSDLSYLMFDIIKNESFASTYLSNIKKKLTVEGDGLKANMTAEFKDMESLAEFTEIKSAGGRFVRQLNRGEEIIETNGKIIRMNGDVMLAWDKTAKKLHFKLKSRNSISSKEWQTDYFLLPEYKRFLHDEGPFRTSYVFSKMAEAGSYLKEGKHDDAYVVLGLILQVEPGDPVAREGIKKLHRLKYIDLLKSFPAPSIFTADDGSIDIEKMKKFTVDSLDENNQGISVDQIYLKGADKLNQGEYLAAQQIFASILEKSPSHYPALIDSLRARLLKSPENPLEVAKAVEELVNIPERPDLIFITEMAYALSGNTQRAKNIMTQLEDEKNMRIFPVTEAMFWLGKDLELENKLSQKSTGID